MKCHSKSEFCNNIGVAVYRRGYLEVALCIACKAMLERGGNRFKPVENKQDAKKKKGGKSYE